MNWRSRSGAAAVEFAVIGMAFVALLLLAMEVGWQMVIDSALGVGARSASRFGTTGAAVAQGVIPPPTDRNTSITDLVILNSGNLLQPSHLQIAEASYASFAAIAGGAGTAGPGSASQVVQYTFTYTQPYLTPIAATITGQSQVVHSLQITVLNEPFPTN
jgi:Flp pilus assembly protein TadG